MSEVITLIIVIGASALAVGLLVALNAFMGGWTRARLSDVTAAGERIGVDVLGFRPSPMATLDAERRTALVFEQGGARLGLAVCRGDKITVRALRPNELVSADAVGSELGLRLDDYTLPQVSLRLGDPTQAQRWVDDIKAFMSQADSKD